MKEDPKALHVSPTGENWEVEKETGTLAQAETKQEAIEAAKDAALDEHVSEIIVHSADGRVEEQIPVQNSPEQQP